MSNFFVAHFRKIKTTAGCIEVIKHNRREKDNLQEVIDTSQSHHNSYFGAESKDFLAKFKEMTANLSRKIQKNASPVIEIVFSFSHEFGDDWEYNPGLKKKIIAYFDNCEEFVEKRYGDVIISRTDHFDEKTPHSHILLIPICVTKDGKRKFSSSEFLGGKKGLFDFHDQFHKQVGVRFGLERGIRESRTKHSDLKNNEEWEKSKKREIEEQQKRLFDLNGDAMKRTAELSKRKLEYEEIEKIQSEQIPQIPVPPVLATEKTRKSWRDEVQLTVNSAFNRLTKVIISFKAKYDDLLEKYQKLVALNENHKNRAEKAENDLLHKPINEIIENRNSRRNDGPEQNKSIGQEGKSHGRG